MMRIATMVVRGLLATAVLSCVSMPATSGLRAQLRPQGPPPRAELEERVRERFEAVVNRELGLDAAQGDSLRAIVMAFQPERRALGRRHMELRRELGELQAPPAAARARSLLDELVEVQREEARILELEIDRLLTLLTPGQVVRFYTLREQMAQRMRRLQERIGRGRGGGPGGGS